LGTSRRLARDSAPVPFPCAFSRYSTLEALRETAKSGSPKAGDELRYLALCRVLVGSVGIADTKGGKPPPDVDSLYFPVDEEYRPLRAAHVLPEFLLLYRLKPNEKRGGARGPARSARAAPPSPGGAAGAALERVARESTDVLRAPGGRGTAATADGGRGRGDFSHLALASCAAPRPPSPPRRGNRSPRADLDLPAADDGGGGNAAGGAATADADDRWEDVLHSALHEKRAIVSSIEALLANGGRRRAT